MKIDGVGFNHGWAKTKTEDEFVKELKDHAHIYPDAKDKVAKLKEVHALLVKTPLPKEGGEKAQAPTSISDGRPFTVK